MTQLLIDKAMLEQIVWALEDSIDDVRTYLADAEQLAGYPRYDRRIAAYKEQVDAHEAAITAGRAALANAEPEGWIAVSDRLPLEADGEVLVRMRDGRHEIAWATYWHGANTGFAEWTFRDQDEDETPTHWMQIIKEQP